MHVLVAFDKFKGARAAQEACSDAASALSSVRPKWSCDECPLTDGGEGFASILTSAAKGQMNIGRVAGPLGKRRTAKYGMVRAGSVPAAALALLNLPNVPASALIAVIEMSQASGLALIEESERNPWTTSTRGTGELIREAINAGAHAILLGVGGSATHDLGVGALSALDIEFIDKHGRQLRSLEPANWPMIDRVVGHGMLYTPPIRIACDVTNPLLGLNGAARVYGPQKGLRLSDQNILEKSSARMAALLCQHFQRDEALVRISGTGAAGGLPFGLMCAFKAELIPGFELLSAWINLPDRLLAADIVVTGEGRFDQSSFEGKGPGSLVKQALKHATPVHVFAGQAAKFARQPKLYVHTITPEGAVTEDAIRDTSVNLMSAVTRVFTQKPATSTTRYREPAPQSLSS